MLNDFDELKKWLNAISDKCPCSCGFDDNPHCYDDYDCLTCWKDTINSSDGKNVDLRRIV